MIVREALNFERGLDPKTSMKIGLEGRIKNWYFERYEADDDNWKDTIIHDILEDTGGIEDPKLDEETKKKWIEFLISIGCHFGEEDWYELKNLEVDIIENLPDQEKEIGDLILIKSKNNLSIAFSSWLDWSDLISERNTSKEFINKVLEGDDFDIFDYDLDTYSLDDVLNFINQNKFKVSFEEIKEKYLEFGGEKEEISEIFEDLEDDDRFEEIKYAILNSAANTASYADEEAALKDIKRWIINTYDLSEEYWDENKSVYICGIKENGAYKLLSVYYNYNYPEVYYPPQGGYNGNWDIKTFNEELENKLAEI